MHIIEKKLKKAEAAYEKEKSGANALALFTCYVLAGKTIDSDGIYINKAYHTAVTAHQDDMLDVDIISALLHANILLENNESAHELIRQLEAHSSFFNKNFPLFYGRILYYNSIVQSRTEKPRGAKKLHRNLELLYERTELTPILGLIGSMQRLVYGDSALCAKIYFEALRKGLRSVYFFLDIYEMLTEQESYTPEMNELARKAIPWALNKGLPIDVIIERLEKKTLIGVLFSLSSGHLSQIFTLTGHTGAFQCLCQKLIFEGDTSEKAFSHYLTALNNNLNLRGLENISIKAAYRNRRFDLPTRVIENALKNPQEYGVGELAFLHGALVEGSDVISEEEAENAVKFGVWAISKGLRGKDYNLIYKLLFDLFPEDGRFGEVVFDELFKYEINFKGTTPKNVCVYEYSKRGVSVFPVDGNKAYVNIIGSDYNCYFLGESPGEYLNISGYNLTKSLLADDGEKMGLYETLYNRGFQSEDIVIALACEYIRKDELSKENIDILQMASNFECISESLKLDICTRLAEHYSRLKQYSIAVHYYRSIGFRGIKPQGALKALRAFVRTGSHSLAVSLIVTMRNALSDTEIFEAMKTLYEFSDSPEIASVCYDLIMNGLCGPEVLSVLLRDFRGTPDEWLAIANKIDLLGFDVSQLYEKIIINGIFTGSIGNDSNEAFIRLYGINADNAVLPKYVYFCCYEIIRNGKTVPDRIADIMEDIYIADDSDQILCCAVALSFIRSGRQDKMTVISEAAAYQEEIGVLLPDFKRFQDKSFISSYIEKNMPFVYLSGAHKTVFFCYKTDDMQAYEKKKAKYFRYGMYIAILPLFYGENLTYYFEEENGTKTEPETYRKTNMRIIEQFNDLFYTVNNAVIYENMMKFEMVERLIEDKLASDENFPIINL